MPFLALNGAVLPASIKMIGEPFYRPLLQGCPDVPKYPELPFPHSPVGGRAANHKSYAYAVGTSLPMEEIAVHASSVHAVAPSRLSQQYKKLESKRVRPYIQCACSSTLPMETHDRHQSNSGEAYMAFPIMLHSCLSCLHWKNWDVQNYSSRQCAAIREHDTLPER